MNDDRRMPAWRRYTGRLYDSASNALTRAVQARQPIVIISGGYGLLLAEEPIGTYDWQFRRADWPHGLVEECLLAVAERIGVEGILGFCARTTGYADVVRGQQRGHVTSRSYSCRPRCTGAEVLKSWCPGPQAKPSGRFSRGSSRRAGTPPPGSRLFRTESDDW